MMHLAKLGATAAALLLAGSAGQAADIIGGPAIEYCSVAGTSNLILEDNIGTLKTEVVRLMDESVAVAKDPQWVNSSRPAFVWASEAKVACGMAYGYLKTNYRDEDTLNKCECFHNRMVEYMN